MRSSRSLPNSVRSAAVAATIAIAVAFALVAPLPSRAHGPMVEITDRGLTPVLLNLFEGTTVHFSTTLSAAEGLVVVDESGLLESPPLKQPGDGWHFTFDKTGSYVIHVRGRPEATMRIVVVPKRTP